MAPVLKASLNSLQDGSEPGQEANLDRFQHWQRRGCTAIEYVNEGLTQKKLPFVGRDIPILTGLPVDSDQNWY